MRYGIWDIDAWFRVLPYWRLMELCAFHNMATSDEVESEQVSEYRADQRQGQTSTILAYSNSRRGKRFSPRDFRTSDFVPGKGRRQDKPPMTMGQIKQSAYFMAAAMGLSPQPKSG